MVRAIRDSFDKVLTRSRWQTCRDHLNQEPEARNGTLSGAGSVSKEPRERLSHCRYSLSLASKIISPKAE